MAFDAHGYSPSAHPVPIRLIEVVDSDRQRGALRAMFADESGCWAGEITHRLDHVIRGLDAAEPAVAPRSRSRPAKAQFKMPGILAVKRASKPWSSRPNQERLSGRTTKRPVNAPEASASSAIHC